MAARALYYVELKQLSSESLAEMLLDITALLTERGSTDMIREVQADRTAALRDESGLSCST